MIKINGFGLIRQKMGISQNAASNFTANIQLKKTVWEDPEKVEVEIFADDEDLIFTDDGFYYQGRRVILYIRDIQNYFGYKTQDPRFHISFCQTLKNMTSQGKAEKYVVSIRTDGIFKLNYISNNVVQKTVEKKLDICKHCLKKVNWQNYNLVPEWQKKIIFENFSVEKYFEIVNNDNSKNFSVLPDYDEETAPINIYPENWKIISKMLRTEAGYICSDCGKKILEPGKLHVHHINEIKRDCCRSNLEVLCADCHQKRHHHKILGSSRNKFNRNFIQENLF